MSHCVGKAIMDAAPDNGGHSVLSARVRRERERERERERRGGGGGRGGGKKKRETRPIFSRQTTDLAIH